MTDTRKWSLLAVVLVVAIAAAGWFLAISPKRAEAAKLQQETETQGTANEVLSQQIKVLEAQMADLPTKRARLASIQRNIPDNPALPSLIRDLTAAGRKTGVALDSLAPAAPVSVTPVVPVVPVAPPAGSETTTDPAVPAPAAAPAAPALFAVPLTLEVTGSYFELEQFVNRLEKLKRSFLVDGFTVRAEGDGTESASGLQLSVRAKVFVSPPAPAVPPVPVAGSATAASTSAS